MSRNAYIIGKGGQARVIASFLAHDRIRFAVERDAGPDDILQSDLFSGAPMPRGDYFIGIGNDAVRRSFFDRLQEAGVTPARCIAPTAWVAPTARLGDGVFVGAGAVVMAGAEMADNTMINTLSSLDHDSVLGADSQVTVGVILGSELRIGSRCYFGMKSCVIPRLEIGDGAFVMAGAVVVDSVPAGAKVGGVPARLRPFSPPRAGGPTASGR